MNELQYMYNFTSFSQAGFSELDVIYSNTVQIFSYMQVFLCDYNGDIFRLKEIKLRWQHINLKKIWPTTYCNSYIRKISSFLYDLPWNINPEEFFKVDSIWKTSGKHGFQW